MQPLVSIVIPCHDEPQGNLEMTLRSVSECSEARDLPHEVIVVDDGSRVPVRVPGPSRVLRTRWHGAAEARNAGAFVARGKYIVFLDAHCVVEPGWLRRMLLARESMHATLLAPAIADLAQRAAKGYGQTLASWDLEIEWLSRPACSPCAIPIAPGACLLCTRADFFTLGGFDDGLKPWGFEDIEFSIRAWLAGRTVGVDAATTVGHLFRRKFPYALPQARVLKNAIRVAEVHFSRDRAERVHGAISAQLGNGASGSEAVVHGARDRRRFLRDRRERSDDWFFRRFDILP